MKLNKATAADTASITYEDNLSGRAELGLTGDDAFHVKVSPNGSSWYEALNIAQALGPRDAADRPAGVSGDAEPLEQRQHPRRL